MTMKEDEGKLGRAIAAGLESCAPATPCPPLEEIAALADGSTVGAQRDHLLMHLAECGRCRALFVATRELTDGAAPALQRRWFIVPSAFAAAAVLVIALALTIEKTPDEKLQTAKKEEPAAPKAIVAETGGAAGDGVLVAKAQAPLPSADPAPSRLGKQAPAPSVSLIARMLAQAGDPRQLAALAGIPQNKNFGFADQIDGAALAFRIGMSSLDLEVALLADDGDRAQAQAVRLSALLQALVGDPKKAGLERLSERLEQGEKPSSLAGGSGMIEQMIPRDKQGFARLGAWAEGARLAARSGNLAYFAGGVPDYFRKGALESGVPQGAAVALRELERKVKDPEKIDLGAVAECAEGLCKGF